ncbi:DUF7715 family protein [Mycolicibacterium frederiksbergense]|uniref:DUF7715 family protein n=1 Tax=Mycolicibacterium frederiksbergense TaxID=117567 RepID=UPI003F588373
MKILTAATPPVPNDDDFCENTPGEVVVPYALVCTNPDKAAQCGCDRTHIGVSSHGTTTTVTVTEVDWTIDQLTTSYREHLIESESHTAFSEDTLDETAREGINLSIKVANDHPLGAILRPRYDHTNGLWHYDEAQP